MYEVRDNNQAGYIFAAYSFNMAYRKFSADRLFDGRRFRGHDEVLITDEAGRIASILSRAEAGDGIEHVAGILSPGLINCHCHVELSHLKNVIPPHTGLIDFLCSVVTKRGFAPEVVQQEIANAEREMYQGGIVAVGDICNTADAVSTKAGSRMRWHSFIEVLSFTDARAAENMQHYHQVLQQHLQGLAAPHRSVLTPHAPYSISPATFAMLNEATAGQTISIHNQEHPAEDELYKTGGGGLLNLFKIFGVEKSPFPVTGKSSLQSCLPYFNREQTLFLIHNTYIPEEDIVFANRYAAANGLQLIYCLCINANLYIENKTPPIERLMNNGCKLVLGTDSYSSNWQLSIAKEIGSIQQYFPTLPLDTILQWATLNGAEALHWADDLGSFDAGKRPGLTVLETNEAGIIESSRKLL